jgi:hypothetical protein
MRTSAAISLIQKQIKHADELRAQRIDWERFNPWKRETEVILKRLFGVGSDHVKEFDRINYTPMVVVLSAGPSRDDTVFYRKGLTEAAAFLEVLKDEIRRDSRLGFYSSSRGNDSFPEKDKITLHWLFMHMPIRFLGFLIGLLAATFLLGVRAGQIPWLREFFGK